jgi:uncharacterized protein with NRDE domain
MCITFFFANPAPKAGAFRLILAFNRDEVLNRTTDPLKWEAANGNVLCGRDMTPGREGGTWLGMSRSGRVALLTNISTGQMGVKTGKGRGHVIVDYLQNDDVSAVDYVANLAASDDDYNPFNLCLLEPRTDGSKTYDISYYCRGKEGHSVKSEGPETIPHGVGGISNHPRSKPFKKTAFGQGLMQGIVKSHSGNVDDLLAELKSLLLNGAKHLPDEQMLEQCGGNRAFVDDLCSIYVDAPRLNYGTRMQTFILIDYEGNVIFEEHTGEGEKRETWTKRREVFKI